jgi:DNA-binding ferritin-like protein (Dps family)
LADQVGSSADFAPTKQQGDVQNELQKDGEAAQQEMQQVISKDVAAFNAMLREKNIANIIVKTP